MDATSAVDTFQLQKRERRTLRAWTASVFLFVLAAEVIGAYWIVYKNGAFMNDAISRTANAYYVLFLEPHKLASIGFVWNPLPSLIQLLILPFSAFWNPLATYGLSGSISTALFAAANAAVLFRYFKQVKLSSAMSLLITLLYAFNPFVFYYGLNGMSETLFFTSLIVCTANFALWADDRRTGRLVAIGLMLAIGFLTRYETFALALAAGLAMLIIIYLMKDRKSPFVKKSMKMKWNYSVATGCILFLPVLYAIAMWMFLNWTIMGDPFFFFDWAYSNESQSSVALHSGFKEMVSNPWDAFTYMVGRMFPFLPPFLVLTGARIKTKRLFKPDYLIFVALLGALTGFHYFMLIVGKSFGWLRFYCFALILSVAWALYELAQLRGQMKQGTAWMLCLSLLLSGAILPIYFQDAELGKEEYAAFHGSDLLQIAEQMEVAEQINAKYSDSTILMDAFMTPSLILNINHPEHLITNTADDIFDLAVADPQAQEIDYLVVPNNLSSYEYDGDTAVIGGVGALDSLNKEYPDLYRRGADWADLVYSTKKFKVYKVLQWDASTKELTTLVNNSYSDALLLFDNSTTGMLHKDMLNPENAITLTSEDFKAAVANPRQYDVAYVIVPKEQVDASGSRDDILVQYPELMEGGTDWAAQVYENDLYRMYEVIYPEGWGKETEQEEETTGTDVPAGQASDQQIALAQFLNAASDRSLLLTDLAMEKPLLDLLEHPESMFTSSSVGFDSAVREPQRYQVILIFK